MPYDVAVPAFSGNEETKSYICLYDSKALEALQYSIGDELVLTIIGKVTLKQQQENNTPGSSRRVDFEVKAVGIETPIRTKLKNSQF